MKILTILGTRPEIIRLSRIIPKLDLICDHRVFHTGQNYDRNLNDVFFEELDLRQPDYTISNEQSYFSVQLGKIFIGVETYINQFKPDRVLVLGDTNSSLSAVVFERLGIPVYHMEAGNRCYDLKVPEEKNRRIIDTVSSINLPYTWQSRENLLREGYPNNQIYVTGNPIKEVIDYYQSKIDERDILARLGVEQGDYIIATAHRAENVDVDERLVSIFRAFEQISQEKQIVFSCHPRTRARLNQFGVNTENPRIKIVEPLGFFDFVKLEQNSFMAITDSGTVQEEMCLFNIPTVTIRDTTERPETVWCGSNIVSGLNSKNIVRCYEQAKTIPTDWTVPEGYDKSNVSDTVINILSR